MHAAPFRVAALAWFVGWETIAWAGGTIVFDTSLVDDVDHAWLAVLSAPRSSRAVSLAVRCKMAITCLTFASFWPVASFAHDIHHSGQFMMAASHSGTSFAFGSGIAVARNCCAAFWPVMFASLILSHFIFYLNRRQKSPSNAPFSRVLTLGAVTLRAELLRCDCSVVYLLGHHCAFTSVSQRRTGCWEGAKRTGTGNLLKKVWERVWLSGHRPFFFVSEGGVFL
jgi:hypothetical protein